MTIRSDSKPSGKLSTKIIRAKRQKPSLWWHLRHKSRWSYIHGWLGYIVAPWFSKLFGIVTINTRLMVQHIKADGTIIDYGVTHYGKLIVDDGVEFIVDAFANTVEMENMKFHGIGTSSTAPAVGNAALVAELTTQYNPDNTRATGTTAEGATANIYQTVATNTLDAGATIEEFGLFDQASNAGGVMFERALTGTQTLSANDGLQTTYEVTFNSGG